MNAKVRNIAVAGVVAVFASMALASVNVGLIVRIDESASSAPSGKATAAATAALTVEEEMQDLFEQAFKAQVAQRQAAALTLEAREEASWLTRDAWQFAATVDSAAQVAAASDHDLVGALTAMGIGVT